MQSQTQTQINPAEIKKRRELLGITQPQLATLVGVSSETISNWETGATDPQNKMAKLIEVLNSESDNAPVLRGAKSRGNSVSARLTAIEARLSSLEQRVASNDDDLENIAAAQEDISSLLSDVRAVTSLLDPRDPNQRDH